MRNLEKFVSESELTKWETRFAAYRSSPNRQTILKWLSRFDDAHLGIAKRILDNVILVSELDIQIGYKAILTNLSGWSKNGSDREGRWYFVGVGSAGESGPAMLRLFREANGLQSQKWQEFFVSARELPGLALSAFDSVVFVDDFAGTGRQIVTYWPLMQELIASEAKCILALTAITKEASLSISRNTELEICAAISILPTGNVYDDSCNLFDEEEKQTLDHYGKIAWRDNPRGFGECGLTLVLSHKTPNNTLPILHANNNKWEGPFPRNLIRDSQNE